MSTILGANGVPLPNEEEKARAARLAAWMDGVLRYLSTPQGDPPEPLPDLNDVCSIAVNLIIGAFRQIPPEAEKPFIANISQILSFALGNTSAEKAQHRAVHQTLMREKSQSNLQ